MENIRLGIRENWQQFTLLVIVNAFVGGMVGLERAILPTFADARFHINSQTTLLSFIVFFGISKAITNYFTGKLANRFGRRKLLILGWLIGFPVPFIFIFAQNWSWIVFANLLLGINQGLAWSSTVVMKTDLAGDKERGFAMGLNEFAGYLSVALIAYLSSYIAQTYGIHPYPFYIGIAMVILGLFSSIFLVKDTSKFQIYECKNSQVKLLQNTFWQTTWQHKNLGSVSQAGFVNNLNDGLVWGILPILLAQKGFNIAQIGLIAGIYPAVWGFSQIFTGKLADVFCKKDLLFWGMFLQGIVLVFLPFSNQVIHFIITSVLLGLGTALVYPTFLATIAENTNPTNRAESMGIFRFWRDLGYAVGALCTGILSDFFNAKTAILFIAFLTILSALIVFYRMYCANKIHAILKPN